MFPPSFRHPDLVSSINSNEFESALLNFQVGSPICGQLAIDFSHAIISQVKNGAANEFANFVQNASPLWNEQEQFFIYNKERGDNDNGNNNQRERLDGDNIGSAKYILLINVDAEYKYE